MERLTKPLINSAVLLLVLLLWGATALSAQDKVYHYGGGFAVVDNPDEATYKREVHQKAGSKVKVVTFSRLNSEWEKQDQFTAKQKDNVWKIRKPKNAFFPERVIRTFHPTGNGMYYFSDSLWRKTTIRRGTATSVMPLHLQDSVYAYHPNGTLKSAALYDNNRLVSSENWLSNGKPYFDDIHHYVDKVPEHTYGQAYFRAVIMDAFQKAGVDVTQIHGSTEVGWVVMPDSTAVGFHGSGGKLKPVNKIIIDAISNLPGHWVPARLNGKPVRFHMLIPF
ncbi:MAG TPA: hypothetical protein VJ951_12705, partial [Bacteroidales bacterium]|nr:hypothetical protein [Bacteroidales bacterium]